VSSDLVGVEEKGRISQPLLAVGSVINFLLIKMHFTKWILLQLQANITELSGMR